MNVYFWAVPIILALAAAILAWVGFDEWGWFLFAAIITTPETFVRSKIED